MFAGWQLTALDLIGSQQLRECRVDEGQLNKHCYSWMFQINVQLIKCLYDYHRRHFVIFVNRGNARAMVMVTVMMMEAMVRAWTMVWTKEFPEEVVPGGTTGGGARICWACKMIIFNMMIIVIWRDVMIVMIERYDDNKTIIYRLPILTNTYLVRFPSL